MMAIAAVFGFERWYLERQVALRLFDQRLKAENRRSPSAGLRCHGTFSRLPTNPLTDPPTNQSSQSASHEHHTDRHLGRHRAVGPASAMTTPTPSRCFGAPSTAPSCLPRASPISTRPALGRTTLWLGTTPNIATAASATSVQPNATRVTMSPSLPHATGCSSRPATSTRRAGLAPPAIGRPSAQSRSIPSAIPPLQLTRRRQ